MTSVADIMDALASQIETTMGSAVPDLQVEGRMMWNPTPPAIDIYPADPFQAGLGFGKGNREYFFTVRARVDTPDREGAQDLLLSFMDANSAESVEQAILSDETLNNTVETVSVDGPSDFGAFIDPGDNPLLGCTWRVEVIPKRETT